jgi:hypothetical protein
VGLLELEASKLMIGSPEPRRMSGERRNCRSGQ